VRIEALMNWRPPPIYRVEYLFLANDRRVLVTVVLVFIPDPAFRRPPELSTLLMGTSEGLGDIEGSEETVSVECAII
jgi:hypothetical protein